MKRCFHIILLAGVLLAGCGTFASAAANQPPGLPFVLVTAAPNASPTPTPFQPIPLSPTSTALPSPTIDPFTPTPTVPPPTETPLPTIDPNILINTLVPFSTIEASGNSQVLNNGQETVTFLLIGSDKRPGGAFGTDTLRIAILRP